MAGRKRAAGSQREVQEERPKPEDRRDGHRPPEADHAAGDQEGQGRARRPDAVSAGALDAAICDVETARPDWSVLASDERVWLTASAHRPEAREPLPEGLIARDCAWRDLARKALERTGRPDRVVFTSESVTGIVAAVRSGIAVALLGEADLGRKKQGHDRGLGPGLERVARLPAVAPSRLVLMCRPGLDPQTGAAVEVAVRVAMGTERGR